MSVGKNVHTLRFRSKLDAYSSHMFHIFFFLLVTFLSIPPLINFPAYILKYLQFLFPLVKMDFLFLSLSDKALPVRYLLVLLHMLVSDLGESPSPNQNTFFRVHCQYLI